MVAGNKILLRNSVMVTVILRIYTSGTILCPINISVCKILKTLLTNYYKLLNPSCPLGTENIYFRSEILLSNQFTE